MLVISKRLSSILKWNDWEYWGHASALTTDVFFTFTTCLRDNELSLKLYLNFNLCVIAQRDPDISVWLSVFHSVLSCSTLGAPKSSYVKVCWVLSTERAAPEILSLEHIDGESGYWGIVTQGEQKLRSLVSDRVSENKKWEKLSVELRTVLYRKYFEISIAISILLDFSRFRSLRPQRTWPIILCFRLTSILYIFS